MIEVKYSTSFALVKYEKYYTENRHNRSFAGYQWERLVR